jgi:hypothetical protein
VGCEVSLVEAAAVGWSVAEGLVDAGWSILRVGPAGARLRRLPDRADRELYLSLVERAAEAAGVKG